MNRQGALCNTASSLVPRPLPQPFRQHSACRAQRSGRYGLASCSARSKLTAITARNPATTVSRLSAARGSQHVRHSRPINGFVKGDPLRYVITIKQELPPPPPPTHTHIHARADKHTHTHTYTRARAHAHASRICSEEKKCRLDPFHCFVSSRDKTVTTCFVLCSQIYRRS